MKRDERILKLLLESDTVHTVDSIASRFQVCSRTVRNDLNAMSGILGTHGLRLSKVPGRGVSILGPEEKRLQLINHLNALSETAPFSADFRRRYILRQLLLEESGSELPTVTRLARSLYSSRTAIYKDIERAKQWLQPFHMDIQIEGRQGLHLTGCGEPSEEKNMRDALVSLLYEERSPTASDLRMDGQTREQLEKLLGDDYEKVVSVISKFKPVLFCHFSREALISFVMHVAIALKRLRAGNEIVLPPTMLAELRRKREYETAERLAAELQQALNVVLPESEIGYILFHILGAKMQHTGEIFSPHDLPWDEADNPAVDIAKSVIQLSENALHVDLSQDHNLLNALILHLIPAVNRLKYGLSLKNPLLEQIKTEYPDLYGLAWMSNKIFERFLGIQAGEEEIGYIALHLGAALERAKKPLRAWVVCPSGIGTSEYIAAKIRHWFHEVEIVDVLSIPGLEDRTEEVDLIISTVALETNKPLITISPLLTAVDIRLLTLFFEEVRKSKQNSM